MANPLLDGISAYEEIIQLLGFSPARVNDQYTINNALKNYEEHIIKRRSRLLAMFATAVKNGDVDARHKTLSIMHKFSRKYSGLRITSRTLKRSLRTRLRYAQEQTNGIRLNKNLANQLHEEVLF